MALLVLSGASVCRAEPTELRIALRFVQGCVAVDSERSELGHPTPAAKADKARLLKFVDERLKKLGPVCMWNEYVNGLKWDTTDVAKISGTWTDGTNKLQAWFKAKRGDADLANLNYWSTDVIGRRLADTQISSPFWRIENDTPLQLASTDDYGIGLNGVIVFTVATPVSASELDAAVIGDNDSATPLLAGIRRGIASQVNKLWWSADITAASEDYLRLYAIDPAESWGPTSFYLKANASQKQLHVAGPAPVAIVEIRTASAADDFALQLLIASYNLFPTDYFRGLRTTAPNEKYGVRPVPKLTAPGTYYINFADAGLVPPRFPPVTLGLEAAAKSESRLADLGYTQALGGSPNAITVTFTSPAETAVEETAREKADPGAPQVAAVRKNYLGLNIGRHSGTKYEAGVRYQRSQIAGTDTLEVGGGVVENLAQGEFNYTRDYVAFPQLGRRLSLSAQADRQPATDRQVNDEPVTEKKDQVTGRAGLEVWRNANGHWLNLEANVTALRSRLQNKDAASAPLDVKFDATTATLHAIYSHVGYAGSLPWTDLDAELGWGRPSGADSGDYRWTRWSVIHRRVLFAALRWESRGRVHLAAGDAPLAEQPSFGGEDSVRGFSRDSARGKLAWSVQNELWFRPSAGFGLPKDLATLVRRNLAVALFADIGGVSRPTEHRMPFGSGGGIGLRYVQGPVTMRADWAHTLGHRGDVRGGSSGYFTVEVRPSF